ncbi:hypothetical protein JOE51_005109 [Bradyrhizobium japonicum]|uniref:hypothetical protein n=1 Tax=Bradyrhizobium TaxID=374 RepID=UPI0013740DAF|nr:MULTISPECIES: hypothetical protein [Bradyrhizobium]MBP1063642.1 hypothetical protein [Bradyrhizobium japonicum]QHP68925.1 hypothetical protein EI171_17610 [Bradyrhizobium sp. LCT2]
MDRLPCILYFIFVTEFGFVTLSLLQGRSANDTLLWGLFASVVSILISVGLLRWTGLPLNATIGEYNERRRFMRNKVTRVSTNDDVASG